MRVEKVCEVYRDAASFWGVLPGRRLSPCRAPIRCGAFEGGVETRSPSSSLGLAERAGLLGVRVDPACQPSRVGSRKGAPSPVAPAAPLFADEFSSTAGGVGVPALPRSLAIADAAAVRSAVMLTLRRELESLASAVPLTLSLAMVLASSSARFQPAYSPAGTSAMAEPALLLPFWALLLDPAATEASGVCAAESIDARAA